MDDRREDLSTPAWPEFDWSVELARHAAQRVDGESRRPPSPIARRRESEPSPSPIELVRRVSRLLRMPEDEHFLDRAYRLLLGRAPDPDGSRAYLSSLRGGTARSDVLGTIARSDEALSRRRATPDGPVDRYGLAIELACRGIAIERDDVLFAEHAFEIVLGRGPSPDELDAWAELRRSGGGDEELAAWLGQRAAGTVGGLVVILAARNAALAAGVAEQLRAARAGVTRVEEAVAGCAAGIDVLDDRIRQLDARVRELEERFGEPPSGVVGKQDRGRDGSPMEG